MRQKQKQKRGQNRRILTFFLSFLCIILLSDLPVLAVSGSTGHFVRSKVYQGQFSDLNQDSVFYNNITALYEYGLSVGKPDGSFGLNDSMTVGQMIVFAGRIRSLYRTGNPEAGPGAYQFESSSGSRSTVMPYLRYLQTEGVLNTEFDNRLLTVINRAEVAHLLVNILPQSELPLINHDLVMQAYDSPVFLPDVSSRTKYAQDILLLYQAGISAGSDSVGSYYPEQPINRGAAAAMLTRLIDASLRIKLNWDLSRTWSAAGKTMGDLVLDGTYTATPQNYNELDSCIRYMLSRNQSRLSLNYQNLSSNSVKQIMNGALEIVKEGYVEQCYNTVVCTYSSNGSLVLNFSAAAAGKSLQQYRNSAMQAAIAVHDQMWKSGRITKASSEYEKARVYYDWICDSCEYDYSATNESISHIAYSLFENGRAVCDGYTGAYNLLLKLEDIQCSAQSNSTHIWTVATLDGTTYHIDTTWGDSQGGNRNEYFAMTPAQSRQKHPW